MSQPKWKYTILKIFPKLCWILFWHENCTNRWIFHKIWENRWYTLSVPFLSQELIQSVRLLLIFELDILACKIYFFLIEAKCHNNFFDWLLDHWFIFCFQVTHNLHSLLPTPYRPHLFFMQAVIVYFQYCSSRRYLILQYST